jgi:hypothetical protein
LCHHAGLERSQAYRILSDLQDEKVLESSNALRSGEVAPRHRPSKRYVLTEDLNVREQIEVELSSFLPDSEDAHESQQLVRARQSLRMLSMDLVSTSFASMDLTELHAWQSAFEKRLHDVQRVLKRAFWESEADCSEEDHSDHPIIKARLEFEALETRFLQLIRTEETRLTEAKALRSWSHIFSAAVATLVPILNVASPAVSQDLFESAFRLSTELIRELSKKPRTKDTWLTANHDAMLRYFSSWELDVRDARSSSDVLAALAKNCIVYGKHPDIAYQLCHRLVSENEDYRSIFNYANLAYLSERPDEAYNSWLRYIALRNKRRNPCATQSLVARVCGDQWSTKAYERAVQIITRECKASVSAFSETPFEKSEQCAIEPQLYNPLFEEVEGESPLISVAEPLSQEKRIYIVTTEAQRPVVVGLPRVVRANLFHCGISEQQAWDLSIVSVEDERIIKVDLFMSATQENRDLVQDVLTSRLSATIVGPMMASNPAATSALTR